MLITVMGLFTFLAIMIVNASIFHFVVPFFKTHAFLYLSIVFVCLLSLF